MTSAKTSAPCGTDASPRCFASPPPSSSAASVSVFPPHRSRRGSSLMNAPILYFAYGPMLSTSHRLERRCPTGLRALGTAWLPDRQLGFTRSSAGLEGELTTLARPGAIVPRRRLRGVRPAVPRLDRPRSRDRIRRLSSRRSDRVDLQWRSDAAGAPQRALDGCTVGSLATIGPNSSGLLLCGGPSPGVA